MGGSSREDTREGPHQPPEVSLASHLTLLAGKLALCCQVWLTLTKDTWVLQAAAGHRLEFSHFPPLTIQTVSSSEFQPPLSATDIIKELLAKGAISAIPLHRVRFVSPFLVPNGAPPT